MKRGVKQEILADLKIKMVFLVGPRQVGKTWLAKDIMKEYKKPMYLNHDNEEHRQIMKSYEWPPGTDLVVFDEIHKMKKWKNYIKGAFDTRPDGMHILVTGSARMDAFRKMGDSMAGRYFVTHLFPLDLYELKITKENERYSPKTLENLLSRSGYPEPFLDENLQLERWQYTYTDNLLREDVFNLQAVENISALRYIYDALKTRVGSPISYANLAGDLGISPVTVKKYVLLLEALYLIFIIRPYSKKISRSVQKEPKVYFYDYTVVPDLSNRFENFVALSLFSQVQHKQDSTGKKYSLNFLKTKDGQEVDFAIVSDIQEITKAIEVKLSASEVGDGLEYFHRKYGIPAIQIVYNLQMERMKNGVEVRDPSYLAQDLL